MTAHRTWSNWVGNQTFKYAQTSTPADEDQVRAAVARAAGAGMRVRAPGAGHSFTPVVATDGLLLDLERMRGVLVVDTEHARVTALPATTVADFGEPLWDAGLALANQGDIDNQTIAGAMATATHGSGLELPSFSAKLRRARVVLASGDVVEIGEDDPRLPAVQVAIGLLGVITELEVSAAPAYRMSERIEHWTWEEAFSRFDELARAHRHFSFFWCPSEASGALYGLTAPPGSRIADSCYVKIYDAVGDDVPDSATPDARVGRPYTIYPTEFAPNFHELEYFVPYERGREAIAAMRDLMLARQPVAVFPMEVRTVAAEDAWLSHSYGRDSVVISISGQPGTDYEPYLREVD